MAAASWLALSDSDEEKIIAYEIATRSSAVYGAEFDALPAASDLVLARLGNFPGRELLRTRYGSLREVSSEIGALLSLESLIREAENTPIGINGARPLTDFQYELFETMRTASTVSVSAHYFCRKIICFRFRGFIRKTTKPFERRHRLYRSYPGAYSTGNIDAEARIDHQRTSHCSCSISATPTFAGGGTQRRGIRSDTRETFKFAEFRRR